MTSTLNTSNFLFFFLSYLKMIRVEVLEKFTIPILDVTYWDFIIGVAIASVVITVLVSGVRIGLLFGNSPSKKGNVQHNVGGLASQRRAMEQGNHSSKSGFSNSGGVRHSPSKSSPNLYAGKPPRR